MENPKTLQMLVTEAFDSMHNKPRDELSSEFSRHYLAGLQNLKEKKYEQSLQEYGRALDYLNDSGSIRGVIESMKGLLPKPETNKAGMISNIISLYEEMIATWPTIQSYSGYIAFLANISKENNLDLYGKAAMIGEECLEFHKDSKEMYTLMFKVYANTDDCLKAHDCMVKACELDPENLGYFEKHFRVNLFAVRPGTKDINTQPINIIWNNYTKKNKENLDFLEDMLSVAQDYNGFTNEKFRNDLICILFNKRHKRELMAGKYLPREIAITPDNKVFFQKLLSILIAEMQPSIEEPKVEIVNDAPKKSLNPNAYEIIQDEKPLEKILLPEEIMNELGQYVIGQEHAQMVISVGLYKHLLKIRYGNNFEAEKSNILLIGPTGSGKTFLAKQIAGIVNLPFVTVDCTNITEVGYVGDDAIDALKTLYYLSEQKKQNPNHGIIYFDEIDKIAASESSFGIDVHGRGAQQPLLKMIEGQKYTIMKNKHNPSEGIIEIDTSGILCIAGGSFAGDHGKKSIYDITRERKNKKGKIGFGASADNNRLEALPNTEDLKDFGMLPELVGRFPIVSCLDELSVSQLEEILVKPKNSLLKQKEAYFRMQGTELVVTDDAVSLIALEAKKSGIGARGLNNIISKILLDFEFKNPSSPAKQIIIDENYARERLKL